MGKLMTFRLASGLAALSLMILAQASLASGQGRGEQLLLAAEYFQWREYFNNGERLLWEKGTRVGFGIEKANRRRIYPGFRYHLAGVLQLGRVGYDGFSQDDQGNFTPLQTQADYLGLNLRLLGGQRYGMLFPGHMLDLLAGADVELWLRRVLDSRDQGGQAVSGFAASYQVSSLRLAAGLFHRQGRHASYLQLGLKYPLVIWERASNDQVELLPGKDIAWFARLDLDGMLPFAQPGMGISLYYENLRFKASAVVDGYYQPRSRMDRVGLMVRF